MLSDGTDPRLVFALIARLPEGSMTRALQEGGEEYWHHFLGVSREYYALAGVYDALNTNTAATGWFKKPPKFDPWPTPQRAVEREKKKPKTLLDVYRSWGGSTSAPVDEDGLQVF